MEECFVIMPQEMLIEILLRLPLESLARFKCVSKSWMAFSYLQSLFARSHYDLALACTDILLLSMDIWCEIAFIDFTDYTTKLLKPPIPQLDHYDELLFNRGNYWIADCNFCGVAIVAFDLTERGFFYIALPDGFKTVYKCELHALHAVIGGFLSVYNRHHKLLVTEEYNKVQSSWKWKSLCFTTEPCWILPICITVGGDIVRIDFGFTKLVKFNKGQVLEHGDYDDYLDPGHRVVVMHTHALLSLPAQDI